MDAINLLHPSSLWCNKCYGIEYTFRVPAHIPILWQAQSTAWKLVGLSVHTPPSFFTRNKSWFWLEKKIFRPTYKTMIEKPPQSNSIRALEDPVKLILHTEIALGLEHPRWSVKGLWEVLERFCQEQCKTIAAISFHSRDECLAYLFHKVRTSIPNK